MDAPAHWQNEILDDRFTLTEVLGQGASGVVYRAEDLLFGGEVAVKVLAPRTEIERGRIDREIEALKTLDVPGVVKLVAHGESGEHPWMAMTLVEGTPFPGPASTEEPGPWDTIARTVDALLDTLEQVHAQGFTHRDLKPANLLVNAEGLPTLLDFGVARARTRGHTVTREGMMVGTPRYLAPEQIAGQRADARADLYALGVMLHEHLAGAPPFPDDDIQVLMRRKLLERPRPLAEVAAHVPLHVTAVVDRLLAIRPQARPQNAGEVRAALQAGAALDGPLPRLGGEAPLQALIQAGRQGQAMDIAGPPGSGRTRLIEEACAALEAEGHGLIRIGPGRRPLESLGPLLSTLDLPNTPGDPASKAEAALIEQLQSGVILVADPADALDRWTGTLLTRVRGQGAVFRVTQEPNGARGPAPDLILSPLSEADLQPLFAGPDRLLHLREDGARTLYNRSGGLPRRVVAELIAWLGAGLALWIDGQVHLTRAALQRLNLNPLPAPPEDAPATLEALEGQEMLEEQLAWITLAWPESTPARLAECTGQPQWTLEMEIEELVRLGAVRELLDGRLEPRVPARALQRWDPARRQSARRSVIQALPPGAPGRLTHLLALGEPGPIADEALKRAEDRFVAGDIEEAMGALSAALRVFRSLADADRDRGAPLDEGVLNQHLSLLTAYVKSALHLQSPEALKQALDALEASALPRRRIGDLQTLVEAALEAKGDGALAALDRLDGLGPFADNELECARHERRLAIALSRDLVRAEQIIEELATWAEGSDDHTRGKYAGWLGILRYRQGRYADAAQFQEEAAHLKKDVGSRLSARINAAIAQLAAFDYPLARALAEEALQESQQHRFTTLEAFAESLIRCLDYRLEQTEQPDLDLVQAARALGDSEQLAVISLNEAVVAWRAAQYDVAARLAQESIEVGQRSGQRPVALLARGLLANVEPTSMDTLSDLVEEAQALPIQRVAAQAIGLARLAAGADAPDQWASQIQQLTQHEPARISHFRLEVMSLSELANRATEEPAHP